MDPLKNFPQRAATFGAVCGLLIAVGCGGEKPVTGVNGQKTKAGAPKTEKSLAVTPAVAHRSVFTIDQNSRDPFFPQVRKAPANATAQPVAATQMAAADIPGLLSAGLQGIGGTPDHRIALINNIMLEAGRSTVIPVRLGNEQRKISVKCKKVARNSVALEVEGYGLLIVKPKETL